jgi:hypothetical protein
LKLPGDSQGIPWERIVADSQGIPWESLGVPWELRVLTVCCCFSKGDPFMTLLPLTDCCVLLGVDPKTLRLWLTSAHLSWSAHPTDARLKCLTSTHLHLLAKLHDRFLPDPLPGEEGPSGLVPIAPAASTQAASSQQSAPSVSVASLPDVQDLRHQFLLLHAQVTTLQQQVTELALALLRDRFSAGSTLLTPTPAPLPALPLPKPVAASSSRHRARATKPMATTVPDRPRSRALPLLEYAADGQLVIISPTQGVLSLVPASPAWFEWLASLTSFAFRGHHGQFSATRKFRAGQRIQTWNLHRSLHGRSCTLYLGLTPTLTLARLEEMAATALARLTTL